VRLGKKDSPGWTVAETATNSGSEERPPPSVSVRRRFSASLAVVPRLLRLALLVALVSAGGCKRGPQLCIFDGTGIGITPLPMVALRPDGTLDPESRYSWQEFPWPTDPQVETVERTPLGWVFRGTTGGKPWSFVGGFTGPAGAFVRTGQADGPPPMEVEGQAGKPTLLRYRVKPCREFEGSKTGVRSCRNWGRELNARTKLVCE
jgi:hypothetical protein